MQVLEEPEQVTLFLGASYFNKTTNDTENTLTSILIDLNNTTSPFVKELIGKLLDKNPVSRPSTEELMEN